MSAEKRRRQGSQCRCPQNDASEAQAIDLHRRLVVEGGNKCAGRVVPSPCIDGHRTQVVATMIEGSGDARHRVVVERGQQLRNTFGRSDNIVVDHRQEIIIFGECFFEEQLALGGDEIAADETAREIYRVGRRPKISAEALRKGALGSRAVGRPRRSLTREAISSLRFSITAFAATSSCVADALVGSRRRDEVDARRKGDERQARLGGIRG